MDKNEILDRLAELVRVHKELEDSITRAVLDARSAGASWGEISTRLGITRQSAHAKYRRAEASTRRLKAVPDEQSQ